MGLTAPGMPSRAARVIAAKFFGFAPDTRGVYGSDSPSRSEIAPFAAEHPLTSASTLAIFRAGLDHQDGAIAAQVDAHYALRSMTTELKRLESALADLT